MHILLLSRYARLGASSRLRSFQYLPYLEQAGFAVTVAPLFDDDYVRGLSSGTISKFSILKAYWLRLRFILKAKQFDLVWLEYELLPWLPAWLELTLFPRNVPLVVDYDDAIFHRYDQHRFRLVRKLLGHKIDAVMRRAAVVVVGNEYLGDRARQAGAKRVVVLPTVVDATRYAVVEKVNAQAVTIGWIGQPSTAKYLSQLVPELNGILAKHGARIVAIGPKTEQFQFLPVVVKPWAEDTEVADIQKFDIGIMPLSESLWERGKCGYKLIQYMACGKPVVATPIGVNNIIVRHGENGFLANAVAEWCEALDKLCGDAVLRKRMGEEGRKIVEENYSLQVAAPRLAEIFRSVTIPVE
ncbi:MAG TPA: glycosyl transferase family 1 [Gallionella sp.]|nr:MAG: glycosyl transferase family 1 [Gallionellales bacterium GWA2_54_124]HCI53572.1 glycosyl transferase family 1 [Gallionella sp.]